MKMKIGTLAHLHTWFAKIFTAWGLDERVSSDHWDLSVVATQIKTDRSIYLGIHT